MLKNLIKYEFKATGRLLIPAYIALIVLAFLNKFLISYQLVESIMHSYTAIIQVITMSAYVGTMVTTIVITLLIIIQRFYKNLLGNQGYLMNTLPVKTWHNITAKLIVSSIWTIASGFVAIISVLLMFSNFSDFGWHVRNFFTSVSYALEEVYLHVGINMFFYFAEALILFIIVVASSILRIYSAIAIGHLVSHKIIASFGAYIGLGFIFYIYLFISQIIGIFDENISDNISIFIKNNPNTSAHIILWGIILAIGIVTAIYWIITNYILKNKLNLE
ncbi:ABC transporter permease [Clostridium sp. BJN0001]|uniref:ABC transporter permease n=1 Tax=Clostridium sp. BJN0001 TaxID=2930219 RepID=UPI001FD4DB09|nr:ABC transporter permease [Clostridium sp. BJN0001]